MFSIQDTQGVTKALIWSDSDHSLVWNRSMSNRRKRLICEKVFPMAVNSSQASRAYTAGDKKSKAQQIKILAYKCTFTVPF